MRRHLSQGQLLSKGIVGPDAVSTGTPMFIAGCHGHTSVLRGGHQREGILLYAVIFMFMGSCVLLYLVSICLLQGKKT